MKLAEFLLPKNVTNFIVSICTGAASHYSIRHIFILLIIVTINLYTWIYLLTTTDNNNGNTSRSKFTDSNSGTEDGGKFEVANIYQDEQLFTKYDLTKIDMNDLTFRVQELLNIRISVLTELRQLERNRTAILHQIVARNAELEKLKLTITKRTTELERLHLNIKQAIVAQREAKDRVGTLVEPPLNVFPIVALGDKKKSNKNKQPINDDDVDSSIRHCQMYNCFDYSRCSLFSPFYAYIYPSRFVLNNNVDDDNNITNRPQSQLRYNSLLTKTFATSTYITTNATIACVYILLLIPNSYEHRLLLKSGRQARIFNQYLHTLPHWSGDGHNNVIINALDVPYTDLRLWGVQTRKAILIQSTTTSAINFRPYFDLLVPNWHLVYNQSHFSTATTSTTTTTTFASYFSQSHLSLPLTPARRKYFLTYLGTITNVDNDNDENNRIYRDFSLNSNNIRMAIKRSLVNLQTKLNTITTHKANELLFDFDCDEKTRQLCDNQTLILLQSTFSLILPPIISATTDAPTFDDELCTRLLAALSTGAIPVLIGGDNGGRVRLPLDEYLDWDRAIVRFPVARITEVYVTLKTFTDADLIQLRSGGAHLYHTYMSSVDRLADTVLATLRSRLRIPPMAARSATSVEYHYNEPRYDLETLSKNGLNTNSTFLLYSSRVRPYSDDEENVGPLEPPFSSLIYRRNYSIAFMEQYRSWNEPYHSSLYTFPAMPTDPVLPSEAKFIGSSYGFRPIANGIGGSGKEFSEALGGNYAREQFTIVMLTYEREQILIGALQRFKDLPYLNKVIVVWNSPTAPPSTLKWPDIGVDIVVIKGARNSLNNRFLPYDDIKTDAILSMDDDASFRHDEIVFAFRVWREARDRIVGFPARYHSWDAPHGSWLYNSNYTCEFSMILTGAAFFHKYYAYLYSYSMPALIRAKVDEYMNCEDIAMNFLVSHLTRKPPIKVTSRWTFRCVDCQTSLSELDLHYQRRHACLNYFTAIYGYMPLLYTQFRADSVLFKTRIPHDKQKCFKYI